MYGEDVDDAEETGPGINGYAPSGPLSTKQMTDDAEGRQSHSRFSTKYHAESPMVVVPSVHWSGGFTTLSGVDCSLFWSWLACQST